MFNAIVADEEVIGDAIEMAVEFAVAGIGEGLD